MIGDRMSLLKQCWSLIRAQWCAYVEGTDDLKLTMIADCSVVTFNSICVF